MGGYLEERASDNGTKFFRYGLFDSADASAEALLWQVLGEPPTGVSTDMREDEAEALALFGGRLAATACSAAAAGP